MNSLYKYILSLLPVLLLGLSSCEDTLLYDAADIPEGKSTVTATIDFHRFDNTSLGSRTAGDAYDFIRNLWILVYSSDGSELLTTHEVKISKPVTEKTEATIPLDFGRYQIYAVANINLKQRAESEYSSVESLKSLRLEWEQDDNREPLLNDEMIGVFTRNNTESDGTDAIVVNRKTVNISASLVRAASKVTVAYDGSALEDGVSVFIRSLSIKRIPTSCFLGNDNSVASGEQLTDGATIVYHDYSQDNNYTSSSPTIVNKATPFYPRKDAVIEDQPAYSDSNDPHAHTSTNSLFFYENLQGTHDDIDKCKYEDNDGDGRLDWIFPHERLPFATYIEVDARWESTNPKYPGVTDVKYRFMLGQDIQYDYNATRNHHYKLTLHLHGYAADPDWRIDYERILSVTPAREVDYRGKFLVPKDNYANYGNDFNDEDIITVNSYKFQEDNDWDYEHRGEIGVKYEFLDENSVKMDQQPAWLNFEEIKVPDTDAVRGVKRFKITYNVSEPEKVTMNTVIASKQYTGVTDLALDDDNKMTTANCYIVDGTGTFKFPLVYGNAIEGGSDNTKSYSGFSGGRELSTMVNYLNKDISSPYIIQDIKKYDTSFNDTKLTPYVVWTDMEHFDPDAVKYQKDLYTNIGGIKFDINTAEEGNVVIAIKDNSGVIMWSWHIWVTGIDYKKNIATLTSRFGSKFDIMPVNLGWCSEGDPLKFYPRRACKIKFTQTENNESDEPLSQTIDIVMHPFVGVPMGTSPYFQWGRKDPFVGSAARWTNKKWYTETVSDGKKTLKTGVGQHFDVNKQWGGNYYNCYYTETETLTTGNPDKRKFTREIIYDLIRNPDKFNNARRVGFRPKGTNGDNDSGSEGVIADEIYSNLWTSIKTVYDPCPAGFQVSPMATFQGFTYTGWDIEYMDDNRKDDKGNLLTNFPESALPTYEKAWFNVTEGNMHPDYKYQKGLFGFYANDTKLEPLTFTNNGYLDYAAVQVYWPSNHGYIWIAENIDNNRSFFLKYCRDAWSDLPTDAIPLGFVGPTSGFNTSDGCSVRPTRVHQ